MTHKTFNWTEPTTNDDWNNEIVAEGLHLKWHNESNRPAKYPSSQLQNMLDSHKRKRDILKPIRDEAEALLTAFSELSSNSVSTLFSVGFIKNDSAGDFQTEKVTDINKWYKVDRVVKLIEKEIEFREADTYPRNPVGTTYYIDADSGSDSNDGLGTGTAWATANKFTEAARSAGDIAIMRMNTTASYETGSFLDFTSNGTQANPIKLQADWGDAFGDHADSAQTYTLTQGSLTATASATITDLAAGDMVYNSTDSDDPSDLCREVKSVSGTTLTFYQPWIGSEGSGKTLKNMGTLPVYGSGTTSDLIYFNADDYWFIDGIYIDGTQGNSNILCQSAAMGNIVKNFVTDRNSAAGDHISVSSVSDPMFFKWRTEPSGTFHILDHSGTATIYIKDFLFDGNSKAIDRAVYVDTNGMNITLEDGTIQNCVTGIDMETTAYNGNIRCRNVSFSGNTNDVEVDPNNEQRPDVFIEDYASTPGDTRIWGRHSTTDTTTFLESSTSKTRTGGSDTTFKVTPNYCGDWPAGRIKLLDIPIYSDNTSKTYTVYFASDATTDWTANPTADEVFLEAHYYCHATNATRCVAKSTGTLDFTTDTNFDQTLSVTVQPSQAGILYLKAYYGKPKESGKTNEFYVDPVIEIS
jgi:hypothetical protein